MTATVWPQADRALAAFQVFGLNWVDLLIVVLVIFFAVMGWRSGFVQGIAGLAGFVLGAALALKLAPKLSDFLSLSPLLSTLVALLALIVLGVIGQVLGSKLGEWIMGLIGIAPIRWVNSLAGVILYAFAALVIAWMFGTLLGSMSSGSISDAVKASKLLPRIGSALPAPVRDYVDSATSGRAGIPSILGTIGQGSVLEVPPPSPGVVGKDAVRAALPSVVRVFGDTPECGGGMTGSGYVSAPGQVTTNAHVVAGVTTPMIAAPGVRGTLAATVLVFDPQQDIAVLSVPGLTAEPLKVGAPADTGQSSVVAGYPNGGDLKAIPARVKVRMDDGQMVGTDIYGDGTVERDIYIIRARVRPGDSGGPLLLPNGTVIGVVYAQGADDSSTGYAITAGQAAAAQRAAKGRTGAVDTGQCINSAAKAGGPAGN